MVVALVRKEGVGLSVGHVGPAFAVVGTGLLTKLRMVFEVVSKKTG
jgi:hypothetical protein